MSGKRAPAFEGVSSKVEIEHESSVKKDTGEMFIFSSYQEFIGAVALRSIDQKSCYWIDEECLFIVLFDTFPLKSWEEYFFGEVILPGVQLIWNPYDTTENDLEGIAGVIFCDDGLLQRVISQAIANKLGEKYDFRARKHNASEDLYDLGYVWDIFLHFMSSLGDIFSSEEEVQKCNEHLVTYEDFLREKFAGLNVHVPLRREPLTERAMIARCH
jgi:hypothetical protein